MASQTFFKLYQEIDATEAYSVKKKQVDSLLNLSNIEKDYRSISLIASDFAISRGYKSRFNEAIYYTTLAISAIKSTDANENTQKLLATLYFRNGFFKEKTNDIANAFIDYEKTISLNYDPSRAAQSYCRIGIIYQGKGDFYKAIDYYNKGIFILEELKDNKRLITEYLNVSIVYGNIGDKSSLLKKVEYLNKVEKLKQHPSFTIENEASLNRNFASAYVTPVMFEFEKAKKYQFKVLKILLSNQEEYTYRLCEAYINLADLYNFAKKDSAYFYVEKSLQLCQDSLDIAKSYNHYAIYYSNKKTYRLALDNIQKTLQYLGVSTNLIDEVPSVSVLKNSLNKLYLVEVFNQKAEILFNIAKEEESTEYLELALANVSISDLLITLIQNESKEEQSHFYWQEMAAPVYSNGVAISKALDNMDKVFYFMEKNKATLLTSAVISNSNKAVLPDTIRFQEKQKLNSIISIEYEIGMASKNQLGKLQSDLFNAKEAFKLFRDSVRKRYPNYYTKKISEVVSLNQAQASLSENEGVLSYLWKDNKNTDHVLYGLYITKNTADVFEVDSFYSVSKAISHYKQLLSRPFETAQEQNDFNLIANTLYKALLPFNIMERITDINQLTIIPDGKLQNLPFETFQTDTSKNSYLLYKLTTSYAYSLSFLMYNKAIKRKSKYDFTGFAPVSYSNDFLPKLPDALNELNNIQEIMDGTIHLQNEATKKNFITSTTNTKIIHLSTHAEAGKNPWVAFRDDKLYLNEIYTSQNQAELVVLSGCSTLDGETVRGEGVLSLARGFFYAGANSLVSNAWEANDRSTSDILQSFYGYLEDGETKAQALQKAKITYLEINSLSQSSPNYWASLLLVGDQKAIQFSNQPSSVYFYLLIALFVVILLILIIYYKKRKKIG